MNSNHELGKLARCREIRAQSHCASDWLTIKRSLAAFGLYKRLGKSSSHRIGNEKSGWVVLNRVTWQQEQQKQLEALRKVL